MATSRPAPGPHPTTRGPDAVTPRAAPATSAPAGGITLSRASVQATNARITASMDAVLTRRELYASIRADLQAEAEALRRLPNRSLADQAVLKGREAQIQTADEALKHLDTIFGSLTAHKRAIADGVLTIDEERNLRIAEGALSQADVVLMARWNAATSVVQRGLEFGGRGTTQYLETF